MDTGAETPRAGDGWFGFALAGLWIVAIFCAVASGWTGEILLRRPDALREAPRYWIGPAFLAGAAALIVLAACAKRNRSGKFGGWMSLLIGLVVVGAGTLYATGIGGRAKCGANGLMAGTALQAMSQAAINGLNDSGELPKSFVAELLQSGLADRLYGDCLGVLASDVVIGRYTMRDLETGRVSKEALVQEAIEVAQRGGEWEWFGVVAFSHKAESYDKAIWESTLSFAVFPNANGLNCQMAMGDGSVSGYYFSSEDAGGALAQKMRAWAAELGGDRRTPPADELATEFRKRLIASKQ